MAKARIKNRFLFLLIALLFLLMMAPVVEYLEDTLDRKFLASLIYLCVTAMLIGCIFAVSTHATQKISTILLAASVVLLQWLGLALESAGLELVEKSLGALFLTYIEVLLIRYLFLARKVDQEMIIASLCGYLILAFLWSYLYSLSYMLEPNSLALPYAEGEAPSEMKLGGAESVMLIYYSIITLSTLGYGDILPMTSATRMLASLQTIAGQIYLTVLVARLVGLHISNAMEAKKNEKQE